MSLSRALVAARAAISVFPSTTVQTPYGSFTLPVVMVAIAGGESGWRADAGGDTPRTLRNLGLTASAEKAKTFNCPLGSEDGPASWGLWQILMPVHRDKLGRLGAPTSDPCATAAWLKVPQNNTMAAKSIYDSQGLGAWSVYKNGAYRQHLQTARTAVAMAEAEKWGPQPVIPGVEEISILELAVGMFAAMAGAVGGYLLTRRWRWGKGR